MKFEVFNLIVKYNYELKKMFRHGLGNIATKHMDLGIIRHEISWLNSIG